MTDPSQPELGESAIAEVEERVDLPRMFRVLLHNDDYTTQEFVVMILVSIFRKNDEDAERIMLSVHHLGVGVAGVYPKEIAESKMARVHRLAKAKSYPLLCSMEPSDVHA